MELQPVDSLKIIQDIIRQRKQKIVVFTTDYYSIFYR